MRRASANLLLLLAGAVWGMGFVAQSTAMAAIGPMLFLGTRFLLATVAVAPFALRESRRASKPVDRPLVAGFIVCGSALFVGMAAQQIGLLTTSVTNSGFLTGLYVVFTPVIAFLSTRRLPHPVIWPAALSCLIGIWLLSGGALVSLRLGDCLTIFCALVFAVQVTLVGTYAQRSGRPLALAFAQFAVCAAAGIVCALFLEPIAWGALKNAAPEIAYAGVFSSALAFSLQVIGQRYTTAPQAAIFLSTEALFAAIFGWLVLGETLGTERLAGCLFIFAAIISVEIVPLFSEGRKQRRQLARPDGGPLRTGDLSHSHARAEE